MKFTSIGRCEICVLLLVLYAGTSVWVPNAHSQEVVIADTEFQPNDWGTTVFQLLGSASHVVEQGQEVGNPDSFRSMSHTIEPVGGAHIWVFHEYLAAEYTPSGDGSIVSISYSEDRIEFDPPFPGAEIGAAAAILQDGLIFLGPYTTFANLGWQTNNNLDLVEEDFAPFADTIHPDFSSSGSTIRFGYIRSNSSPNGVFSTFHGIDNWEFVISVGLIGDVNGDSVVNLLDVAPFVEVLANGTYQYEADINQDGVVNLLDVALFVEILI